MPITTPEQLSRVAYAVHAHVANKKKPTAIDRQKMVLLDILGKRKEAASATGGVWKWKLKHDDGGAMQFFQRKDVLAFTESEFQLEMQYPFANMHQGREFTHEDLFELGYDVVPNATRGKNFASGASDSDAERVVNYFEEAIESMMDKFDVELDKILHRDGSYDSKSLVGLDGILPIANTAGTIGGVSRSNPLVRHYVETNLTVTAGGSLLSGLTRARRACLLNGRGHNLGGGLVIVAGAGFVDGYRSYAIANGIEYKWDPTKVLNGLDIGIPEASFQFEGVPIVWDPTFEYLDTIEPSASPAWTKRAYVLAPKTWKLVVGNKMDKKFSAPLDKAEQRVTRLSLDSRLSLGNVCPNANAVIAIA